MTCFPFPISIVKQLNGNVFIYNNDTGDFVKSLSSDIIKIQCNENGIVKVILDNGSIEYFDPSLVVDTQILPASAILFGGDCTDLSELLSTDFFFELTGGGGGSTSDSFKYVKNNSISFLESNTNIAIRTFLLNEIVFYPIHVKQGVDITHAQLQVTTTAGASSRTMVGIYDNGTDGLPTNLITSVEINTTSNSLFSTAFSSPQTLGKGVYWVATCTNISYAAYCLRSGTLGVAQNTFVNVVSSDTGGGLNIYERYRLSYTYNNSLPAIITSPLTLTVSDYANPFVTFKIDY